MAARVGMEELRALRKVAAQAVVVAQMVMVILRVAVPQVAVMLTAMAM